jgi:hypothetical protein
MEKVMEEDRKCQERYEREMREKQEEEKRRSQTENDTGKPTSSDTTSQGKLKQNLTNHDSKLALDEVKYNL